MIARQKQHQFGYLASERSQPPGLDETYGINQLTLMTLDTFSNQSDEMIPQRMPINRQARQTLHQNHFTLLEDFRCALGLQGTQKIVKCTVLGSSLAQLIHSMVSPGKGHL